MRQTTRRNFLILGITTSQKLSTTLVWGEMRLVSMMIDAIYLLVGGFVTRLACVDFNQILFFNDSREVVQKDTKSQSGSY